MGKKIVLGHGSGGKLSHELIREVFIKHLGNPCLDKQTDSAVLESAPLISFTTDTYVVDPIFFPGGDIGKLAICGTVNDLAVSGAKPRYISVAFVLEEGFPLEDLETIVLSMKHEAIKAGVIIVTGDTKVVGKGKCDKIFINTTGIGYIDERHQDIGTGSRVSAGDKIIINGDIGDHGIAVLSAREQLSFTSNVRSDCAPLNHLIETVLTGHKIGFMRDATRGGLATVLCELSNKTGLGITIDENTLPVNPDVNAACEIFGYEPLYMANEGKVVMVVKAGIAEEVLTIMHAHEYGKKAAIIGEVTSNHKGMVVLNTLIGGKRIIDMLTGDQLPRIC